MPHTIIIGYGNPLRGDDGLGWRVAERLRDLVDPQAAEVLTPHQLAPELMEVISRADLVVFLDASEGGAPGEIRERVVEPQPGRLLFSHHASPEALLAGARALYGRAPHAVILSVAGADFSISDKLSPLVAAQVEPMVSRALRLLT